MHGWSLTDAGRRLSTVYHESDLLVAEAVCGRRARGRRARDRGRGPLGRRLREAPGPHGSSARPGRPPGGPPRGARAPGDRLGERRRAELAERLGRLAVHHERIRALGGGPHGPADGPARARARHRRRRLGPGGVASGPRSRWRPGTWARSPRGTSCAPSASWLTWSIRSEWWPPDASRWPRRRGRPRSPAQRRRGGRDAALIRHRRRQCRPKVARSCSPTWKSASARKKSRSSSAISRTSTARSSPWSTSPRS